MQISKANAVTGKLVMPGDKSISHRAAMLASIATGNTRIENFATSADCGSTLECLGLLGVKFEREHTNILINGLGKRGFRPPAEPLDCGNSGTTMRLLAGILAGQPFSSTLTGDQSLRLRPMKRVIEPLVHMGATIDSQDGRAPLVIKGEHLKGTEYTPPVASAQIKSCVLLAGLLADGNTSVIEKTPTRDHTERMLSWFGVEVVTEQVPSGTRLTVSGDNMLQARDLQVPGDVSSAAFFMVAAACLPGSRLELIGLGLNPSRTAIIETLKNLGAEIEIRNERLESNEPVGDICVDGGLKERHNGPKNLLRGSVIANLIDEIPILAVFGTQLKHGLEVRNASELRVKESDRIAAVVENLKRMGGSVTEFDDGFKIERSDLFGATVDSFGDHRIAMAFAVAGLFADGSTRIIGADCANVSFPGFFDALATVRQ